MELLLLFTDQVIEPHTHNQALLLVLFLLKMEFHRGTGKYLPMDLLGKIQL